MKESRRSDDVNEFMGSWKREMKRASFATARRENESAGHSGPDGDNAGGTPYYPDVYRATCLCGWTQAGDGLSMILALAGLWQLDPAGDWRAQAQRIYDIVLSGIQQST